MQIPGYDPEDDYGFGPAVGQGVQRKSVWPGRGVTQAQLDAIGAPFTSVPTAQRAAARAQALRTANPYAPKGTGGLGIRDPAEGPMGWMRTMGDIPMAIYAQRAREAAEGGTPFTLPSEEAAGLPASQDVAAGAKALLEARRNVASQQEGAQSQSEVPQGSVLTDVGQSMGNSYSFSPFSFGPGLRRPNVRGPRAQQPQEQTPAIPTRLGIDDIWER